MRELAAPRSAPAQQASHDPPAVQQHAPVNDGPSTRGATNVGATGLGGGQDHSGPHLNPFWNNIFGGPNPTAGDGRPLDQNHIGTRSGWGPLNEGGPMSTVMRNTPYLGDYWNGLAITHDSMRIGNNPLNAITGVTNVGLAGPVMGLVDAPFRAFGHSLFMDDIDDGKGPLTEPWNTVKEGAGNAWDWTRNTASDAWSSAAGGATNAWNGAKETASNAWDSIKSW